MTHAALAVAAALEHVGAQLVIDCATHRLYHQPRAGLRWLVGSAGLLLASDALGTWRVVSDHTRRTFIRAGDIVMRRNNRPADHQLALALQDARAAAGTASADNTETARQRRQIDAGARQPPAEPAIPMSAARAAGEAAIALAAEKAEREVSDFVRTAAVRALIFLADMQPHSGEEIVDAVKDAGVLPTNDRAFGAVILLLSRRGLIRKVGSAQRRKGHGTAGATLWQRNAPPPLRPAERRPQAALG